MAKQSVLDIVIRTIKQGSGDKELIGGLKSVKATISSAVTTFAALAGAAYTVKKVFEATVGELVTYADQVRRLSQATGKSAEDSSRLIQVLDDMKVSYEQIEKAVAKSGKTFDYSIEGLAAMSDDYLKLSDAQSQAAFMQERFGKQWISFVPVMQKGGEAIRTAAGEIERSLILTEKALVETRLYEMQVDKMSDAWMAFKIQMGSGILGLIDGSTVAIQKSAQAIFEQANGFQFNTNNAGRYTQAQRDAWTEAQKLAEEQYVLASGLDTASTSLEDQAAAAEALEVNYKDLIGSIQSMQSETDRYQEAQADANAAIEQANADFAAGKMTADEHNAALADNQAALDANAAAHQRWAAETVFAFAQAKAAADGSISEGEGQILIEMGVQLGLFDEQTAQTMENVNKAFDNVDTENAQEVINALKAQMEELTGQPWVITIESTDNTNLPSSGGSSGGISYHALGTGGWRTVPAGFPNDNYLVGLTSGEQYRVATASDARMGATNNDNSKRIVIQNLTVVAKGSVMDVLEELS
jgi:hypothetical protein